MFSRKGAATVPAKARMKNGAPGLSLIGAEVTIGGDLTSEGALHIDGRIEGHVRCASLCQSASGVISGDIVAEEARIGGLVEGTVSARNLLIEATGRVAGDVTYDTISIAAGAQVDGRLARRAVLGGGTGDLLVAMPADPEQAAGALFSGQPTRIVVD